jgi:malto-oligosyltrehalose trehalohydrolase
MSAAPRFGPRLEPDGGVTFRLWAPAAKQVELVLDSAVAMQATGDGWYACRVEHARAGTLYRFCIDGELEVPDPASHFQPDDVQGPSEVIDHRYAWRCADWKGKPWNEAVFLEAHVGTFTPAGTFRSAIERLDHLVATGITAIELMPLADFAGRWNWGYDGVLLYAPDSAYGRPDDLKALIDAAHVRGLMVFLDVVYNHFGPEGNYLSRYAPQVFTSRHKTPWGHAIDYRVTEVRAFAIENALHWLDHYRFDGLRLDAVHAIAEPGEPHILHDLSRAVGELAAATGRHIHLVLENDDNRASLLDPAAEVPRGKYRAQWNDDYHHAWHVLLTGETDGYYSDYAQRPAEAVARAVGGGFVYQGEASAHRGGVPRGEPTTALPPAAFVNFLQNHDQIGNRAYGDRLETLASAEAIECALAVTLLAPSPPLLFMGEEWGATQPFPFFCDFKGELAEAVRKGRRSEFEAAFANVKDVDEIPDPLAESTFRSAALDWSVITKGPHASRLELVRSLLAARRDHLVPLITGIAPGSGEASIRDGVLRAAWRLEGGHVLKLLANVTAQVAAAGAPPPQVTRAIWGGELMPERLAPWSVHWWLEEP